jgi:hypothetical protein
MKKSILLLCFLLTVLSIRAQYFEVGAMTGTSNYIGDLSEQRLSTENFHGLIGIFGRYNATKFLSIKSTLLKGSISGSDENARSASLRERNLSFRSDILEFAVTSEVNFSPYNIRDQKTGVPYFFTGLAVTHFNPQAQMRGAWYDLQPLQTEGKSYKRTTVAIPFGLGMKFNVSYKLNFGLEIGARRTFSDYLDDVSTYYPDIIELRRNAPTTAALAYRTPELTGEFGENPMGIDRGDSGNNDWYFFGGLTVSVNLTDKYGIDFDPEYDVFKEHLKKPEKDKEKKVSKRRKKAKYQQKLRILRKKKQMEPQVKKRTN